MTELFEVKTLEEMPKALNFLIKKVDNLQETVNTLRHKQQASESPRWMNIDELCAYHPSHPKKQTVYEWVSKKTMKKNCCKKPRLLSCQRKGKKYDARLRNRFLARHGRPAWILLLPKTHSEHRAMPCHHGGRCLSLPCRSLCQAADRHTPLSDISFGSQEVQGNSL